MLGKLSILGRNRETYVVNSYHTFIGSHSKCDIRVYGPGISPQHCVVTTQGDNSATIRNLPHNGTTLVNGCDIGMSDYTLSQNDVVKIGNTKLMWSKADGKKSSSKNSSGRLVAVVMPQKRTSDEFSNSAAKRLKLGDTSSLAHSSSFSSFSGQWERRTPKRSLVHSTPAVRRHSRTESFRLLTTSNFFDDSTLHGEESLVDETFQSERSNFSPKMSAKKVCFTSKRIPRKALPSFESPAQKSILKKHTDGLSTPTNVRRTIELNFRSPRNSSSRTVMASPSSTPMRPLHNRRVALTEPRRVLSRTNLSNQIDALCLEKSLLAAKKLKSEPPKLMDKKKLAALLVCHKKKSPRKDFDEGTKILQPKRKSELDNLFIDMKFSTQDKKSPKKSDHRKSNLTKSASSPSILITSNNQTSNKTQRLGNSPSVENMSLSLSVENLNETSQKLSKSKQYKSHALSQLNIDMNDAPKRSVKYSSENDENLSKKSRRSKSLENKPTNEISPKRSKSVKTSVDEKGTKNSKNMSVALKRIQIDMNDFPSRGRKAKSLGVSKSDHKENSNKKSRSKSLENSKPTSIVLPSNVLDGNVTKSKSRALSRLIIDMNDSPRGSKSPNTPERVKKDLSASLNFSPKSKSSVASSNSEKKHKPMMMRAENNVPFTSENLPISPKVDINQIPDLNLSLGIAKNVARILSPLKDKAKRISGESPSQESFVQELDKATRMSAASPSISQDSSPLTDVLEDDLLNALHLSRKSTIVEKPKQPVRRLRSFNKNLNGIKQLFSSEYKQYSKEEVKKLFDDDPKPSTSVGELKRKLYSPIPDNANIKSMDRVFTTSPVVDYTDTSGVKRLFTISPKADYRDPRGIKELFAVTKTNYLDVSGVGDLFASKSRTSLGSNKRKSILVTKTDKRASLAKPQKNDASLKDRLEKKLSLKKSLEYLKIEVKEELQSPKVIAARKRNAEKTKKIVAAKSKMVKKESSSPPKVKSVSPPKRVLRLRGAKPTSPRKSVPRASTKALSSKKAIEKPASEIKEVKTRKRGAKQASSPAKELKTKKRATKKVPSPVKDVEDASNSIKDVKTKKRATKKVSSPAKNIEAASNSAKESKTKKATKKASSPVKSPAKEIKTRKRTAKKVSSPAKVASSPAKELKPRKRATKKVSSPAKVVEAVPSPAKELKTRKRAAKKVSSPAKVVEAVPSPAKELKTRKRAAKKVSSPAKVVEAASSPAKELKTRKRAAKKVSSPAKVVEAVPSPAKELKTRKRAAKKVSSPAKVVEAASSPAKELKTRKRAAKKVSSPVKVAKAASSSSKELKAKKRVTKKTPSPEKEVKTKKRMTKKVANEVETKKATKQASSPSKEVKSKKKTKNQASSPVIKTKKATKKTEEAPSSRSEETSTSRAKKASKKDTAKQPKSPAKPTKSKASPKKTKKPRLIVKITPPKILGSILKKQRGRPKTVKKVLFDQDETLSPSPPKKKTQKKK